MCIRDSPNKLQTQRDNVRAAAQGTLSGAQLAVALRLYTAGLKTHIRTEEKSILPLARTALLEADWVEINHACLLYTSRCV